MEHGRDGAEPGGAVGSGSGGGVAADGVLGRLHECAGFVAVLALLLLPLDEWEECKRYIVVSAAPSENMSSCFRNRGHRSSLF